MCCQNIDRGYFLVILCELNSNTCGWKKMYIYKNTLGFVFFDRNTSFCSIHTDLNVKYDIVSK